ALLAFLVGGAVGLWSWLDDNPQSTGLMEALRRPTRSVLTKVWSFAIFVAGVSYLLLPRWTGRWNPTLVIFTAFLLFVIPLAVAVRLSADVGLGAHRYPARGCPYPLLAQVNPCFQLHGASLHCDLSCPGGNACGTLRPQCGWRSYRLEESRSFRSDCFGDCSAC